MKMLVHRSDGVAALPVNLEDLKAHMRVTGTEEDASIENMGMTAAAELEHFAQIALLNQTIRVTIFEPANEFGLNLPIGPVAEASVPTVTLDGVAFAAFDFVAGNRPYIRWGEDFFRVKPSRLVIEYTAGFGINAADVPWDLRQALMDQAVLHYDARSPMDAKSLTTSPHMARVGARYRGVSA